MQNKMELISCCCWQHYRWFYILLAQYFAPRPISVISSGVQFVIQQNLTWELFENSFSKKDISSFVFLDGWKNEEKKNWCRGIWTPRWDSRAEHGGRGIESV